MFETPIDLTEIRSVLTDAGHTAVGFATLAVKKGNEIRLDASKKYESQISEFRAQALALANRADATASELEDRFVPVVSKLTDRLPAPANKVAADLADQGVSLRQGAHKLVVKALGSTAAKSTAPKASAKSAAGKPAAPKAKAVNAKVAKATKPAAKVAKAAKPAAPRATEVVKAAKPAVAKAARKPRTLKVATA